MICSDGHEINKIHPLILSRRCAEVYFMISYLLFDIGSKRKLPSSYNDKMAERLRRQSQGFELSFTEKIQ